MKNIKVVQHEEGDGIPSLQTALRLIENIRKEGMAIHHGPCPFDKKDG